MVSVGGERSEKNFNLALDAGIWHRQTGLGPAFDSSCGYDVETYRPGQTTEILASPAVVDCNEVMPGFLLNMNGIW